MKSLIFFRQRKASFRVFPRAHIGLRNVSILNIEEFHGKYLVCA